jgi:hypothetical protein
VNVDHDYGSEADDESGEEDEEADKIKDHTKNFILSPK